MKKGVSIFFRNSIWRNLFFLMLGGCFLNAEKELTLEECIQLALSRDPQTKAIKLDIAGDRSKEWAARAAMLPVITGASTMNKLNGTPNSAISVNNVPDSTLNAANAQSNEISWGDAGTVSGQVAYPIFQRGSILGLNNIPAVETAKAGKRINESLFSQAIQTVLLNTTNAYMSYSWFRERSALMKRQVELSEKRLEILNLQEQLAMSDREDVLQAEVQLKNDRFNFENAEDKENASLARLMILTGKEDLAGVSLMPLQKWTIKVPTKADLAATVNPDHPAVRQQKAVTTQALQTVRQSRAALLPTVNVNAAYTRSNDLAGGEDQRFFTAFLTVSAPIFDFGSGISTLKESEHRYESAKLKEIQSQNDLFRQIMTQLEGWRTLGDSLDALDKDFWNQDRLFRLAKVQSEIGMVNAKSYLETEATWIAKKDQLGTIRLNYLITAAQIQQASGGLWSWAK